MLLEDPGSGRDILFGHRFPPHAYLNSVWNVHDLTPVRAMYCPFGTQTAIYSINHHYFRYCVQQQQETKKDY